jgi:hypothetical protein
MDHRVVNRPRFNRRSWQGEARSLSRSGYRFLKPVAEFMAADVGNDGLNSPPERLGLVFDQLGLPKLSLKTFGKERRAIRRSYNAELRMAVLGGSYHAADAQTERHLRIMIGGDQSVLGQSIRLEIEHIRNFSNNPLKLRLTLC